MTKQNHLEIELALSEDQLLRSVEAYIRKVKQILAPKGGVEGTTEK